MWSGELARLAGVSPDTVRYYESLGLLPLPRRTIGNYREYPPDARQRIQLIRNALAVGFSLKELGAVLKVRDQGGVPCAEVHRIIQGKVTAISEKIEELTAYRDQLRKILAEWDDRLRKTGKHQRAYLLQSLAEPPIRPGVRSGWS